MAYVISAVRRRRRVYLVAGLLLSIFAMALMPPSAKAATDRLVVTRDFGGSVAQRYRDVNNLRMRQTRVELRGRCNSACTMYLGLAQTCVMPNARLGFHGPHVRGQPKPLVNSPAARLMAAHYPPALRQWFLTKGQYISGDRMAYFTGRQLIAMGVPRCP